LSKNRTAQYEPNGRETFEDDTANTAWLRSLTARAS
jgi:hypothetical protein